MTISMIAAALLTIGAGIASWFDAEETNKGIKAGVGVENNPLIVPVFGDKPSLMELVFSNSAMIIPFSALGMLSNPALIGAGIGGLVARILSHIYGCREWKWMLSNPTKKLPVPATILQKIFGIWV